MKVLIVEDELPAAEKLERYLLKYDPSSKVIATVDSVAKSVEWLSTNQDTIDLIFMDIQTA
jgi:DNA-binding LytR/AlgR family response regulator